MKLSSGSFMTHKLARSTIWSSNGMDHHNSSKENSVAPIMRSKGVVETKVQTIRLSRAIREVSLIRSIPMTNETSENRVAVKGEAL